MTCHGALRAQEPRLVKLMTALLSAHGEWFRLQRCKDRFSGPLGVDALKEAEPESDVEGAAPERS